MAGIDVAGILAQVQSQNAALQGAASSAQNIFDKISGQSDALAAAAQKAGEDKAAIITQKEQGNLDAQTATRAVAASYGGNPDDVSFIMTKLGSQMQDALAQREQAAQVINEKNQVSLLDDPLQWIMNKLSINDDIQRYNSADTLYEDAVKGLDNINTLNQTTAQGQLAIAKTRTAATVAASADQAQQEANIDVAKAKIQGLLYNAQGVETVMKFNQEQLSNAFQGQQLAISAGHLAVAQAGLALQRQEFSLKSQMWQESLNEKKKADATDAQMVNWYNQGAAALGMKPLDSNKVLAMAKAGGPVSETVRNVIVSGMQSDALGKPVIAETPGAAVRTLAATSSPLAKTNAATKPIIEMLGNAYQTALSPQMVATLGVDKAKPATVDNAVNQVLKPVLQGMSSNIKMDDSTNIYQAPTWQVLSQSKAVQDTPLYQKVLKPLVSGGGVTNTDPNQIMSLASVAIQNKQITLNDAVSGISTVFQAAAGINNETKDYLRFGLPPQSQYKTGISSTGTFGGSTVIDMTNQAAVANALTKIMRNKSASDILGGNSAFIGGML